MSKIITPFVKSLLILGGIGVVTVISANLFSNSSVSVKTDVLIEEFEEIQSSLDRSANFVEYAVSSVDIPEAIESVPIRLPVEIVYDEPIDIVVVAEKYELLEVGVTARIYSGCSWSCDGRCGRRVISPTFHEYTVPEKEPFFESLVFPNPAIDRLTLRLTVSDEIKPMIQLYSSTGKFIRQIQYDPIQEGENDIPVNIVDLQSGIYFLVIYSKELKATTRFIKQ